MATVFSAKTLVAETAFPTDIFESGKNDPRIILIQDMPMNDVAQKDVSKTLSEILKREGLKEIYLEGGAGELSLTGLLKDIDLSNRVETAEKFLSRGDLSSAEYLQLISDEPLNLWGAEDPELHRHAMELLARILRRASSIERVLASAGDNPIAHRLLRVNATEDDLDAWLQDPGSVLAGIRTQDRRLKRSYEATLRLLADYQKNSRLRKRFILENCLNRMKATRTKKCILLIAGRVQPETRKFLEERSIGYEIMRPASEAWMSEKKYTATLSDQLNLSIALPDRPSAWKSLFLQVQAIPLRTLRESLSYDLAQDRRPRLWSVGESLGFTPRQNLNLLFSSLNAETASAMLHNPAPVKFEWARSLFDTAYAGESGMMGNSPMITWGAEALKQIDREYDEEKYKAFKQMCAKTEFLKTEEKPSDPYTSVESLIREYETALDEAYRKKEVKKKSFLDGHAWYHAAARKVWDLFDGIPSSYRVDDAHTRSVMNFLRTNTTEGGMPLSYEAPEGFWKTFESPMDEVDSLMERLLVRYSVSIYDAGLWQIALSMTGDSADWTRVQNHTRRLAGGSSGDLKDIRAYGEVFGYGDEKKQMTKDEGFFFRIIADQYLQDDPTGEIEFLPEFPNFPAPHHEDWKPITGEQAWAAVIGPIQSLYLKNRGVVPVDSEEVGLALSILPAVEAMVSPIGAVYHVPHGTHGKNPNDISNENNASMFAAMGILKQVLGPVNPALTARLDKIRKGQLEYFKKHGFDKDEGVFYQGGFYLDGQFLVSKTFAADCQTWGINALGPQWIDETFGEGTSYRIWENTKKRAGFFDDKEILRGIGFTDGHDIHSVEWTAGAILSVRTLAKFYEKTEPAWADQLKKDAISMRYGLDAFQKKTIRGDDAFLYASKRYFIPWGWWANPIPSMASSAWVIFVDAHFDPFILGGGPDFKGLFTKKT